MRPFVTFLSVATIAAYGCAIAGMGGYLVGHGNLSYIVGGLLCGTLCAAAALYLFKKHPEAFYADADITKKQDP